MFITLAAQPKPKLAQESQQQQQQPSQAVATAAAAAVVAAAPMVVAAASAAAAAVTAAASAAASASAPTSLPLPLPAWASAKPTEPKKAEAETKAQPSATTTTVEPKKTEKTATTTTTAYAQVFTFESPATVVQTSFSAGKYSTWLQLPESLAQKARDALYGATKMQCWSDTVILTSTKDATKTLNLPHTVKDPSEVRSTLDQIKADWVLIPNPHSRWRGDMSEDCIIQTPTIAVRVFFAKISCTETVVFGYMPSLKEMSWCLGGALLDADGKFDAFRALQSKQTIRASVGKWKLQIKRKRDWYNCTSGDQDNKKAKANVE